MVTIGDVFSIVAAIFGLFITAWAASVAIMLLLPQATERARAVAEETPGRTILSGIALLLTVGLVGVVMLGNPLPLMKLLGWTLTLGLLGIAAIGTAGIGQAAGSRIRVLAPEMPAYPAMVRGAAYVIGVTLLPLLGWFLFAPILLLASLGAGWKAVRTPVRHRDSVEAA